MKVIATIVGGIPAYCADPETCSQLDGQRSARSELGSGR
jgi:hypothetical protein